MVVVVMTLGVLVVVVVVLVLVVVLLVPAFVGGAALNESLLVPTFPAQHI